MRPTAWATSALACGVAAAISIILTTTAEFVRIGSTLSVFALLALATAIGLGSQLMVTLACVPALVAGLINVATADQGAEVRALVIGCLWYLAAELAWEAIDARWTGSRTPAVTAKRLNELATVVAVAISVSGVGLLAAGIAPTRTIVVQALAAAALVAALLAATRFITRTQSAAPSD